jgi:hypothetical protein
LITQGDDSGILNIQTNETTALSIDASQKATLANDATISGLTVGKGGGAVSTNTAVGASALGGGSQTGIQNTSIGYQAMLANTSGSYNSAFGHQTMVANTTGEFLAASGFLALTSNTTGVRNAGFGAYALSANTTGGYNTAVGMQALSGNTTASYNTAVGYQAGYAITTSSDNTCVGYTAGNNITTGATNTCIGRNAIPNAATDSNETVVGGGFPFQGKGSNTGYFGGSSGVYNQANSSSWSTTSDQRLKKNIVDNTDGLNKIISVRVRNFEYRLKEEITEVNPSNIIEKTGVQLGVIAQELQAVLPDCVKEESSGVLSVQPDNLNWYMINAIKDLKALVDTQAETINALTARIVALETA